MEFYYGNNLIKEDFLSSLMVWRPDEDWKLKAVGFPFLTLNIRSKALLLHFLEKRSGAEVFSYNVTQLQVSAEDAAGALLLESLDGLEDFGVTFAQPASCAKFLGLVKYYQELSFLNRRVFVETDMPRRQRGPEEQATVLPADDRALRPGGTGRGEADLRDPERDDQ